MRLTHPFVGVSAATLTVRIDSSAGQHGQPVEYFLEYACLVLDASFALHVIRNGGNLPSQGAFVTLIFKELSINGESLSDKARLESSQQHDRCGITSHYSRYENGSICCHNVTQV